MPTAEELIAQGYSVAGSDTAPDTAALLNSGYKVAATPATQRPSFLESAKFVGRSAAEGLADLADLVTPAIWPQSTVRQAMGQSPLPTARELVASAIGSSEDMGITGLAPDLIRTGIKAAVAPGPGRAANVVSALGGEVAHQLFPDSEIAPIVGSVLTSGGIEAGKGMLGLGKSLERSSVGASAKDYLKDLKARNLIDDDEIQQVTTTLGKAINEIGDQEGFGFFRDPQRLIKRNSAELEASGAKLGAYLQAADDVGAKVDPAKLLQTGSKTQELLTKFPAQKAEIKEAVSEFMAKLLDPENGWDGSISGLNKWKSSINELGFAGTAKGTLPASMARKIQRAIGEDLKDAISDAVVKADVVSPKEWANTLKTYSNHKAIEPVLKSGIASSLASTPTKVAKGLLRTSGGTLTTPTVIGSAIGSSVGGPLIGLLTGGALSLFDSPTGQGALGSLMKTAGRATKKYLGGGQFSTSAAIGGLASSDLTDLTAILGGTNARTPNIFSGGSGSAPDIFSPQKKTPVIEEAMPISKEDVALIEEQIDADPYYSALYEAESGRDPNAQPPIDPKTGKRPSTAKGGFQFINSTAKALGVSDPFDLAESFKAVQTLTEDHRKRFGDNPKALYRAHVLGAPLANKVAKGDSLSKDEKDLVEYFNTRAWPNFERRYNRIVKTQSRGSGLEEV